MWNQGIQKCISCGDFCRKVSWIRPLKSISLLQTERPICFPSIDRHLLIRDSACVRTHLFLGLISVLSVPSRLTTLSDHFLQDPALIQCSEFTIGQTCLLCEGDPHRMIMYAMFSLILSIYFYVFRCSGVFPMFVFAPHAFLVPIEARRCYHL